MADRLDTPRENRFRLPRVSLQSEAVNRVAEGIARFTGTPQFLVWLAVFCIAWLSWNTFGPENARFDSAALGFTALTLMLSLQASFSSPLILLAQNRQADRDRVSAEQDRQRAERNLADTEYLAREIAAVRMALGDVATRDYLRGEIRDLLEDILKDRDEREERLREDILRAVAETQSTSQPADDAPIGDVSETESVSETGEDASSPDR